MLGNIDYRNLVDYSHPHLRDCELLLKALPTLRSNYFYDLSPHGRHGTLTNMDPATDWVISQRGMVLDLNGSNQGVELPMAFSASADFTINVWCRLRAGQGAGAGQTYDFFLAFADTLSSGDFGLLYFNDGTTLKWLTTSGTACDYTIALDDDTWHMITAVERGSTAELYVDGALVASDATAAHATYTRFGLSTINDAVLQRAWDGQIDDARVYSRVLTAEEIRDVYLDTLGMRYSWIPRVGAGLPVMSYYQSPTAFVPQIMEYPIQRRQLVAVGYR